MTNEFENEYATHNKSIGMTRDRYRSHSENDMRKVLAYAEKALADAEQDIAEASAPEEKPMSRLVRRITRSLSFFRRK